MNSPARVIAFVNAAHFIDHYAMLIFAAAVIVMGPALGMAYSELLPYATPGFIAFGGGLFQTLMALAPWPLSRYGPERRRANSVIASACSSVSIDPVRSLRTFAIALCAGSPLATKYAARTTPVRPLPAPQ